MRIAHLLALAILGAAASPAVLAKLPPPSEEAQAKAAEAAAKAAWSGKVAGFLLCKSQDRAVAAYQAAMRQAGKEPMAPVATPPCTDPGPYQPASGSAQAPAAPAAPATAAAAPTKS